MLMWVVVPLQLALKGLQMEGCLVVRVLVLVAGMMAAEVALPVLAGVDKAKGACASGVGRMSVQRGRD